MRKRAGVLRDVGRLVAPLDVLYHVGNLIYRRSLRYTAFTAAISIVGNLANRLGLPGLTARQAILFPLIVGTATLAGGFLLRTVPGLISSRLLSVAQANDLNLMEDYRKAEVGEHLRALWDRLFRHECRMRIAAGAPALAGCDVRPAEGPDRALARAEGEFLVRARRALETYEPQIRQLHHVGIDLRYLEDWRDGAYLDASDTKLVEQFQGNATLLAARREADLCGPRAALRFAHRRAAQKLWFAFITRMVAIQIGTAVEHLNARYDTDLFNSQVLLWPGEEDAPWLAAFDGARREVLRRRTAALRRVFGPDARTAGEVLDHMLGPCFACATELRMRFDPEYCDGRLGYDVLADLRAEGRNRRDLRRARRFADQARHDLAAFDDLLRTARPGLFEPAGGEALRAVRGAFHVDRAGLKRRLMRALARTADPTDLPQDVTSVIDAAAAEKDTHTRRLIAVRVHHELTRLARSGYRRLVRALAYPE